MANALPPPRPWNPDAKFNLSDRERWICVYPIYINSKRTLAEGRRLPKDKCIDNPTYSEMRDVLAHAGMVIGVENKVHPSEKDPKDMKFRGRIRVQMKNDDGTAKLDEFSSKWDVYRYLGDMIPKLKHRQSSSQSSSQSGSSKSDSASAGGQSGGGKKKKGKKR